MASWLNDAIFYEIYPPSFYDSNGDGIGDIAGMIEKLDYIRDSGFNAVWLNPWFDSPFRDGGYDIIDFYKVAPRYGTNDDARRFFAAAHERGIRVILDMVICHTAIEHPWFARSGELAPNEFSELFTWSPQLSHRGDREDADDYYVSGWSPRGAFKASFFAVQPAINYGFNVVKHDWEMPYSHPSCVRNRQLAIDIMRFWLDMGCDGFRVDMANHVIKRDPGHRLTSRFWREVRAVFDREYPEAVLVSEWFDPKVSLKAGFHIDFYGGTVFRNDNWMSLTPPTEKVVFSVEGKGDLQGWVEAYLENYRIARSSKGYIGMFSGNHDVWRISYYGDPAGTAVKLALLLTMPGCPFVYYGDEIGMRYIPGLAREGGASRTGSRTPMQWAKGPNLGFSDAAPEELYLPVDARPDAPTVEEALAGGNPVYWTVKELNRLRHAHPALQARGTLEFIHGADGRFPLAYLRKGGRETILVALNPTGRIRKFTAPAAPGRHLAGVGAAVKGAAITLAPESYGVWKM